MHRTPALRVIQQECHGDREGAVEAQTPDLESFESVYKRNLPAIYSYLLAHTGGEEDASELAQQVFAQALAALPRYRSQGVPIRAWLFRIARNLIADFHRRRRPTVGWDLLDDAQQPLADDNVETAVIEREAADELRAVLTRLEPAKRDLLVLRFAAGLKVREIAEVLNRSESAVRSELRRTLKSLQEHIPHD